MAHFCTAKAFHKRFFFGLTHFRKFYISDHFVVDLSHKYPYFQGDAQENFCYFDDMVVEAGKEFVFSFVANKGDGTYIIRIRDDTSDVISQKSFAFVSPIVLKQAIENINRAVSSNKIKDDLELFLLICENYPLFNKMKYEQLPKYIFENRPYNTENINEAFGKVLEGIIIEAFNNSKTVSDIKEIVENDDIPIILDRSEVTETFQDANLIKNKSDIYICMLNKSADTVQNVISIFEDAVITRSIHKASNWGIVETVITKNYSNIGISDSLWKQFILSNKKVSVFTTIAGKNYSNRKELLDDFIKLYNESDVKEKYPGGSSGARGVGSVVSSLVVSSETQIPVIQGSEFVDIDSVSWVIDSIIKLNDLGIIEGRGNNKFCPNEYVTREEFAKMIIKSLDLVDEQAQCEFDDMRRKRNAAPFRYTDNS